MQDDPCGLLVLKVGFRDHVCCVTRDQARSGGDYGLSLDLYESAGIKVACGALYEVYLHLWVAVRDDDTTSHPSCTLSQKGIAALFANFYRGGRLRPYEGSQAWHTGCTTLNAYQTAE